MLRKGMFISDRYEIIDKVGSGGMSDVYKAKCHKLNRFVAIKVLKHEFSEDTSFVSKFKVEAQNAAGLSHPNIVNVYDVGEDNGLYYIVMELIEGITLKKYIEKKGKLPVKEAVSIAIQVAQGIEAAHNNHIIHRDIKPQNIIISREGKVKVTDFGIARAASANTINSNAMGSVHYISPEQARGGFIDEKSDIYSLGITLYEMLTGRVPFEGDSTVTIALQHVQEEIPSAKLFAPELPISVEKIIEKCTQKKPDRRYLKVTSLIADLKRSLVTPDEDFVQLVSQPNAGATVVISGDELKKIRNDAGIKSDMLSDDDEELADDYDQNEEYEDEEYDDDYEDLEDDLESENPKLDKMIMIGGLVTCVIVIMIAVYLAISFFGKGCQGSKGISEKESTTKEQEELDDKHTRIPKVIGLDKDEAKEAINEATLGYRLSEDFSDEVEEGLVMAISLPSGEKLEEGDVVAKNTTIVLVISKGGDTFELEDVAGMLKSDAQAVLKEKKLKVKTEYVDDEEVEIDKVVKTDPVAKSMVKAGDEVTLYISRGKEDGEDTLVPDVRNLTKTKAKVMLEEAGLTLGNVEEVYDDTVEEGKIISQEYTPKDKLPIGTSVSVVISKGPKPTETTTPKETTTEKPTTSKKEDTTQEPSTTAAPVYTASVNLRLSDILQKLEVDEEGRYNGAGVVGIKVDGAWYNGFDYTDINSWPDEWTLELPESDTKKKSTVEVYVDSMSTPIYTVKASYK